MTHARRPPAIFAVLSIVASALVFPHVSAAASRTPAAAHTPAPHAAVVKKAAPQNTGYHPHNGPAPADEYFGRLQMSILGVRNKVKDLGLDSDLHPEHHGAVLNNAVWVEDAMRDWARKYPFDHWLPRYAFALERMYENIPGENAHKRAIKQLGYITAYFPQTVYAKVGRAKLAQGVPEPDPTAAPVVIQNDLQRLALIDGKVIPTMPPAATPRPAATPNVEVTVVPIPASGGLPRP